MGWCFALVNGRLAEIFFDKKRRGDNRIWAHCYVRKEEYKTKREQQQIKQDTARVRFSYRSKKDRFLSSYAQ